MSLFASEATAIACFANSLASWLVHAAHTAIPNEASGTPTRPIRRSRSLGCTTGQPSQGTLAPARAGSRFQSHEPQGPVLSFKLEEWLTRSSRVSTPGAVVGLVRTCPYRGPKSALNTTMHSSQVCAREVTPSSVSHRLLYAHGRLGPPPASTQGSCSGQ